MAKKRVADFPVRVDIHIGVQMFEVHGGAYSV